MRPSGQISERTDQKEQVCRKTGSVNSTGDGGLCGTPRPVSEFKIGYARVVQRCAGLTLGGHDRQPCLPDRCRAWLGDPARQHLGDLIGRTGHRPRRSARAELLAVERLLSLGADRQQVIAQAVTAAWCWAQASLEAISYAGAFGTPADEVSAHDLVALAGWTPLVTAEQVSRLRQAAVGAADRAGFEAALHDESDSEATWIEAFFDSDVPTPMPATERLIS